MDMSSEEYMSMVCATMAVAAVKNGRLFFKKREKVNNVKKTKKNSRLCSVPYLRE